MKNISRKAFVMMAALIIALSVVSVRVLDEYMERKAWEDAADVVYSMTNQNIEWTGAGYSGR